MKPEVSREIEEETVIQDGKVVETEAEFNPYEREIVLPSLGKFYGDKLPGGKVKIRGITVAEEKFFASTKQNMLNNINKVLERCLITKALPLDDYLVTDKMFLFLNMRALSYGNDYSFDSVCGNPNCQGKFKKTVTIPEGLKIRTAKEDSVEPFYVKLPRVGATVGLRFLRGSDEKTVAKYVKQTNSMVEGNAGYSYRMALSLVTIDGQEKEILEKLVFCEKLMGKDSFVFRDAIEKNQTGADLTIESTCPECGEETNSTIQFTSDFFRPSL